MQNVKDHLGQIEDEVRNFWDFFAKTYYSAEGPLCWKFCPYITGCSFLQSIFLRQQGLDCRAKAVLVELHYVGLRFDIVLVQEYVFRAF